MTLGHGELQCVVRLKRARTIGTRLICGVSFMIAAIAAQGHPALAATVESMINTTRDSQMGGAVAYPLEISADRRHLVDRRGRPFLIVGDSPQAIVGNLLPGDAATFVANRKRAGFNSLLVDLLCVKYTGCRDDATTIDGIEPFTTPGDLSTPNPKYFARADAIVRLAEKSGMAVFLDPIETGGWLGVLRANGAKKAYVFGQYVGRRYKRFADIVWWHGNDFQTWRNPSDDAVVLAVARGIRSVDPLHLQTVLLDYLHSGSLDDSRWRPLIQLDSAYTYLPTYAEVLKEYDRPNHMPVFMGEAGYEFEQNTSAISPGTPENLRRQEYWSILAGASGQFYGNHYTWQFAEGWKEHLDTPGSEQVPLSRDALRRSAVVPARAGRGPQGGHLRLRHVPDGRQRRIEFLRDDCCDFRWEAEHLVPSCRRRDHRQHESLWRSRQRSLVRPLKGHIFGRFPGRLSATPAAFGSPRPVPTATATRIGCSSSKLGEESLRLPPLTARGDKVSRPQLSILIVNWNTRDRVLRCLDSLAAATEGIPSEVIVVENGSVDGSPDALARRADIILLENDRNLGYAAAVNQAYERSSGELVLLLNSDVDVSPRPLRSMMSFLDAHPTVAGVAPLYVFPDGSPQPFHFRFPTFPVTLANCSATARRLIPGIDRRLREYRMLDDDFSHARPVPQPSASCLLLRRSVLPDDHMFDERYPIFFNDVQFARSLAARGLDLWVTPEATVVHDGGASTRMLGVTGKRQYLGSTIRMLSETESRSRLWLFRAVVFAQHIPLWLLRRPNTIGMRELCVALSGDVGPLPAAPSARAQ